MVLFSSAIYPEVCAIDKSVPEQVWFRLHSIPSIQFCGAYVAPSDSTYFNTTSLPEIQARTMDKKYQYIIIGDVNARCGNKVHELVEQQCHLSYKPVDLRENENGRDVIQLCKDNSLLVLNNLCGDKAFPGGLSFRRKKRWVSEIDLCLLSAHLISNVHSLHVSQDTSDPSDHAPVSVNFGFSSNLVHPRSILLRAEHTGGHAVLMNKMYSPTLCKKSIPSRLIDPQKLCDELNLCEVPQFTDGETVNSLCTKLADSLYMCSDKAKVTPHHGSSSSLPSRWQRIIECGDPKTLWRAIDWKGEFNPNPEKDKPSDQDFQLHIEKLLNPLNTQDDIWPTVNDQVSITALDDPITKKEMTFAIEKQLKPDKGAGPDGISPAIFHHIPAVWLTFLTSLFNIIFYSVYPRSWSLAKLTMLYKKGFTMDTNNYRGISLINSVTKLYDYIINNRLTSWYIPQREQAGGQPKRSCLEHILTLRLWIDYSKRKRQKLFIAFIDFSKAYDRVPRGKMFAVLKNLGCGVVLLCALMSMYSLTTSVLGTAIITCAIGVRQGSPTSVTLFIIYVDVLIKRLKEKSPPDGFLSWLHVLMLMDDTVLLATSKESLIQKLIILKDYCDEYGMQVNELKTEFMVINGSSKERSTITKDGLVVKHCDSYVYLGVIITESGSMSMALKAHAAEKKKHLNRLHIFLTRNYDAPFFVKRKVFDAAFSTAILYGCESWLGASLEPVERMYMSAVRSLLCVRKSTPKLTCLLETGIPSLTAVVQDKQAKFLKRMLLERSDMNERDPLMFTLNFMSRENPVLHEMIESIMSRSDYVAKDRESLCLQLRGMPPQRSKLCKYLEWNPELTVHSLYTDSHPSSIIDDNLRMVFSRIRLSSHRLRVETGRWNHTPADRRFCHLCNNQTIQDENHLLKCPATRPILEKYNCTTTELNTLFAGSIQKTTLLMLKECLKVLESPSKNR